MKSYQAILVGLLIGFILLSGLILPLRTIPLLVEQDPTPTSTPIAKDYPSVLESGGTQGLMIGAAVIVSIILGGVIIQRVFYKS